MGTACQFDAMIEVDETLTRFPYRHGVMTMVGLLRRCALALSLALLASPLLAQPAAPTPDDGRWRFAVTPYLWATAQEGEASFKGIPPQPVELSFGDIWDNLDFAALFAFEAHNGRWGVATDVVYMNLGAKIPRRVLDLPEPAVDLRQFPRASCSTASTAAPPARACSPTWTSWPAPATTRSAPGSRPS